MSTKAIREALKERSHLRGLLGLPPDDGGDALKEVEAIESACKRIAGGYISVRAHDDEDAHHVALLDNIGEHAP